MNASMVKRMVACIAACVVFLLVGVGIGASGTGAPSLPHALSGTRFLVGMEVIAKYNDGSREHIDLVPAVVTETASATPSQTPTIPPTNTPKPTATPTELAPTASDTPAPSVTPSNTPSATMTPTEAHSATPPPTNTPRPTATQEITPPPTSTPGPTQKPPDPLCEVYWLSGGLNVRAEPRVVPNCENCIGSITGPTTLYVSEIRVNQAGADEWASFAYGERTGWVALFYQGAPYAVANNTPECEYIRTTPESLVPLHLGWHAVLIGVDQNDMLMSFAIWHAASIPVAVKAVETWQPASWAIATGGIGAVRYKRGPLNGGDCANINLTPEDASTDMLARTLPVALTNSPPDAGYWIEVSNECDTLYFDVAGLTWLDYYLSAEINQFSDYYPGRVIFGTMLAGGWTEARVKALRRTWDTALDQGACLGLHQGTLPADFTGGVYYTVWQTLRLDNLWRFLWQQRDIRRWLMDLDPRYQAIPFCVTEWAVGGAWMPWDPNEYADYVSRVTGDNVLIVTAYTAGDWNGAANSINGHMAETAALWP